jgi:hypothetical protein
MIIRNILTEENKNFIHNEWKSSLDKQNDHQAKGTFTIRQADFLHKIHTKVKKILEEETKLKLKEKFTIIREYKKGDKLKPHLDNAAPFAITIVVKQSDDKENPLVFYNEDSTDIIILKEGDGYYFKGMEILHERLEVQSEYLLHIYLGYGYTNKLI